jgi:hypothetical protein
MVLKIIFDCRVGLKMLISHKTCRMEKKLLIAARLCAGV